jgi:hypothetical protein
MAARFPLLLTKSQAHSRKEEFTYLVSVIYALFLKTEADIYARRFL